MKKLWVVAMIYCAFLGAIGTAFADSASPVAMLQNVADQMIASLKANKTSLRTNPTLVYSLAYKIIVPHADLDEMSKRVLPPQTWNNATAGQREQFKKEFTTLLVRTYATALADYSDQSVRFFPIRGGYQGKSNVRVDSQIVRNDGPSINMNYRLLAKGSQWRLYDMTVEGVSLLESFRSQFADQLARGNISNLITNLKQHNAGH